VWIIVFRRVNWLEPEAVKYECRSFSRMPSWRREGKLFLSLPSRDMITCSPMSAS